MLLLNFGHPITDDQREALGKLIRVSVARVIDLPAQFDPHRPFVEQIAPLVAAVPLDKGEWQTEPFVVHLPAFAPLAAVLLAELHGRCGFFPTVVRMRAVSGATPSRYEVAEVIGLQAVRDAARGRR